MWLRCLTLLDSCLGSIAWLLGPTFPVFLQLDYSASHGNKQSFESALHLQSIILVEQQTRRKSWRLITLFWGARSSDRGIEDGWQIGVSLEIGDKFGYVCIKCAQNLRFAKWWFRWVSIDKCWLEAKHIIQWENSWCHKSAHRTILEGWAGHVASYQKAEKQE